MAVTRTCVREANLQRRDKQAQIAVHSALDFSDLLLTLREFYGLPELNTPQDLGLWGTHLRLRFETSDGRRLFLKEKPPYLSDDEFKCQLLLHAHIEHRHGPVAPLLASTTGAVVFSWHGHQFRLSEWARGRHLSSLNANDQTALGQTVARFHKAALDFSSEHCGDWTFPRNRGLVSPERWPEILEYTRFVDHALRTLQADCSMTMAWIRDWVRRHGVAIEHCKLPEQFIHGDVDCFNCIETENGDLLLVDLDESRWGYRLTDIAHAAAMTGGMLISTEDAPAVIRRHWQWRSIERLLSGFSKHTPLTMIERNLFNDSLGLSLIRCFVGGLDLDEPSCATITKELPSHLEALVAMLRALE